jgi:hypothetical protein
MMPDIAKLHAEAIAEGYRDETCSKCGVEFLAHIHFIRCDATPCPMRSTADPRPLLEQFAPSVTSPEGNRK